MNIVDSIDEVYCSSFFWFNIFLKKESLDYLKLYWISDRSEPLFVDYNWKDYKF